MRKLQSINDFKALHSRLMKDRDPDKTTVVISAGTCGQASGANDIISITKREILTRGLTERISLRITGCHGWCEIEPSVLIEPYGTLYPNVTIEGMERIIEAVDQSRVIDDLLYEDPVTGKKIERACDTRFYKKQVRTLMSRNEKIDPIRIFNYISNGGYSSLMAVLEKSNPESVIDEVKKSGIRGRGGAGFPTGVKWELLSKQNCDRGKFLVCNADEGDPGAYMDRSLLEGNPHSIIEGMLIGAYATGATNGIIYVRAEYPLAIKHLVIALRQAGELGLTGKNVLGTDFSFDIQLFRGAGAFVCGEETALIASIEGKMGEPRQRPPFPIQKGIENMPTAINNVETWANVPVIISKGGVGFAKTGTEGNTGTKIFSLVGKARNTGLVEVPLGMKISEVVHEIGGGPSGNKKIKAVQTGGPSGGCIPASQFDLPIDYDNLAKVGTIMGSGGMIVMDESTCMVDVAKYFMSFLKDESCGKCFPCRKGTQRMYEILDDISKGKATMADLDLLEELAAVVKDTTMCGLGQSAANPVLSTLRYFRDEYIEHIVNKRCPAGVCKELTGAPCQSACPIDTEAWRYIAHIAHGEYEQAYAAIREANPFPSVCARVCNHPCELNCRAGAIGGEPISIRSLKRFVTDRVEPSTYVPVMMKESKKTASKIAIVGAGPAGLTAAHYLSLKGYRVSVFESESKPGGMMYTAIPAYRLPRQELDKEINSILNNNITLECNKTLGKDITVDSLLGDGFKSVFLALGAHKSRPLQIEGEDVEGVYPSIKFLRDFNVSGKSGLSGSVGIIGGGNSAIDAARVAIRQEDVREVTILYRRTRLEMPAYAEEIEAALEEGIKLITLATPKRIVATHGKIAGIECLKNELGEPDSSGRRRPVPIEGSEFIISLDALVVAISESSDIDCLTVAGSSAIDTDSKRGIVIVDKDTLATNRPGVFAGGDLVTGPNTIVDAIAAGKKAAVMIDRYIKGEELKQAPIVRLPDKFIPPVEVVSNDTQDAGRVENPRVPVDSRKADFSEVEISLTEEQARYEACRCLRCDLEFTAPQEEEQAETAEERIA